VLGTTGVVQRDLAILCPGGVEVEGGTRVIKASVFSAASASTRFDMDENCQRHIPMVQPTPGSACTGGRRAETGRVCAWLSASELAMSHLYSLQWRTSRPRSRTCCNDHGRHRELTDIQPVIQISEAKMSCRGADTSG